MGRFPITSVERTLLDMAIRYAPDPLDRALAEAELQHDIRPADVLAVLRRRHPGSGNLRASLERHVPGYGQMHSRLERRFRRLLIAHGIELQVRNKRAGGYRVDCLWRHLNLIVELDGGQHERQHRRAADARRDTHLRAQGFVVVRYSWEQVFHHPQEIIDDLLRTMAGLSRRSETSSARAG